MCQRRRSSFLPAYHPRYRAWQSQRSVFTSRTGQPGGQDLELADQIGGPPCFPLSTWLSAGPSVITCVFRHTRGKIVLQIWQ